MGFNLGFWGYLMFTGIFFTGTLGVLLVGLALVERVRRWLKK